jgi:type VI secretion system secreted protein VgrG
MVLTQQERMLKLSTPLGEDVLLLTGFTGQEEISRLFRFQLEMISDNNGIAAADIVGKNVTFSVELSDGSPRFFNGFVNQFVAGDEEHGRRNYRAEVVPWLWFLTQTADCRLFQDKTIKDIIETIFGDLGFSDYKFDLQLDHKKWEYCVQYRETDFNFVSRLMEQEGVSYWFKHADGKHEMVISDHKGAYYDLIEKEVEYPPNVGGVSITDHITSWEHRYEFRPGKWAQTDYNFKTPSTNLMSSEPSVVSLPGIDKYEIYDYPGEFPDKGVGKTETKLRMEEEEVAHDIVQASSQCKSFSPGGKFKITVHRCSSEEGKSFAVTKIRHSATEPMAYETGGSAVNSDYSNSFSCIPDSVVFRAARITPKPLVSGVQTAVVTGPAGEEIYTDEFGRVKVQFHWDREGKKDENSSCWIRVSQNWAGKNWGIVFNPRIGQEVIVDFLEGDPDRPIIVGRVYNATNMPPYELPANQTLSVIKSRSSKEGSPENYNEIRLEDKKGEEQVFIHAEKNQDIEVENDETHWVGHDRTKTIDNDESTSIGNDRQEEVGNDESIQIGHDRREVVKNDESITIEGFFAKSVGKDATINIAGNRTQKVDKEDKLSVSKGQAISVGEDLTVSVTGGRAASVEKNDGLSVGKQLTVEAGDQIVLKTGAAQIIMKKNGDILIQGKNINLKASGKLTAKASSDVVIKGSKIAEN